MSQPPYDPHGNPYEQPHNPYQPQQEPYPQAYSPQPGFPVQQPYVQPPVYYPNQGRPSNGMAVAALVLGIVGIITCGVLSILAVIFGHVSYSQIKRTGEEGKGMAVAGIVLGWIPIALWVLYLLVVVFFGIALLGAGTAGSSSGY